MSIIEPKIDALLEETDKIMSAQKFGIEQKNLLEIHLLFHVLKNFLTKKAIDSTLFSSVSQKVVNAVSAICFKK